MNKKQVSIHIGQMHVGREPTVIYTLLGSCVAICLFDPVARIGGMNHILIPGQAGLQYRNKASRYGDNAIVMLLDRLLEAGALRRRVVAKAFGGAHMFDQMSTENSAGFKNAEAAVACLKRERLSLVNQDLGGYLARKLFFHTDSGDVYLKRLRRVVFSGVR